MRHKAISFRLNLYITSIAVIIISLVVYLSFHYTKKILTGKIEEGAINQSNLVIGKISTITVRTEEIARNVSYQAVYYKKHNDLDVYLKQIISINPVLESLHVEFFADDNSKYTACNSAANCVQRCNKSEKIFGNDSLNYSRGVWSEPFYCGNDSLHLLVTYRHPVRDNQTNKVVGAVFCEVSLKKMRKMLTEVYIDFKGYAFIIGKDGYFITHPNEAWVMKKNIFKNPPFNISDKYQSALNLVSSGKSGSFHGISEYFKGQPAWYYFAPLVDTNWVAVIVISENELFKEVNLIFKRIVWVCGLGIMLLFIFNILIFSKILTPLAQVTKAINKFTSSPGKTDETKDEIEILRSSFDKWQEKYGMLMKEKSKTDTEKRIYEKELKSAREIQQKIVPSGKASFPDHPEIDLYATLRPASKVGGDLYDYFFIDDHHLLIAIGDVSGKGIPASLFMAIASTLIQSNARTLSSKEIVEEVNSELSNRNSDQYFLTLFVGILDLKSGTLDYCNAAHNYPYILRGDGTLQTLSQSHGLPLGIYKEKPYRSSITELHPDDTMILYTDGVINSVDSKNQYYGTDRLEKNLINLSGMTSQEIVEKLVNSLTIFEGEGRQADDISILALKINEKRPET